jgi:60 kDa SS-A/Ro ribonucleoprotein
MANKKLFQSLSGGRRKVDAINEAGGVAYRLEARHALAQLAATGTFEDTFYGSAESQLEQMLNLIGKIEDDRYLAELSIYSRKSMCMKDMPAALVVALAGRNPELMHQVFDRVVDSGKVLRSVFQMVRSGKIAGRDGAVRRGLSGSMQRAFQRWLHEASVVKLLNASIGNDPTLRDILRMARPTPKDNQRRALFGWLAGREVERWSPAKESDLPLEVHGLLEFRRAESEREQLKAMDRLAGVRWDLLADSARGPKVWARIAETMGSQALRMNLNTLMRQGVFEQLSTDGVSMIDVVADRLGSKQEVERSRQFPYQYFAAYLHSREKAPKRIQQSLERAVESACGNVPMLKAPLVIGLDVSGSMGGPVTGRRRIGSTSHMRCVDVAALFAAAILRSNPGSVVIPFDTQAYRGDWRASQSIMKLADELAKFGGGGTNCALPVEAALAWHGRNRFAGVVIVSDNESWVGSECDGETGLIHAWNAFAARQRQLFGEEAHPKMVCIDLQPNTTTQACDRMDIMNVGGFSDAVFSTVGQFFGVTPMHWVDEVEAIDLSA